MAQIVIGLFESDSATENAVERLETAGISRSNVDISRSRGNADGAGDEKERENGITRFFKNLFGDNDDADRYSRGSNSGKHSIVTVHAQSREEAQRASDLLDEFGAVDVDERASQYNRDRQDISSERGRDSDATIPRVQEEINVGKREVEGGGVRVRSRIVERPVEETLRLREEHVRVDRQDVNRPVSESDRSAFQDRDIELTERAEVPVVNKEARVVEEIRISKDVDERNETIHDTVRNTQVDIDNIDSNDSRSRDSRRNEDRRESL